MKLTINIQQTKAGDIEVRMSREAGFYTQREAAYLDAITESITAHVKVEIPRIGKRLGAK